MAQISIAQTDSKESILSRLNRVIFKVKETVSKNEGDRDERQLFYLLSSLYYNDCDDMVSWGQVGEGFSGDDTADLIRFDATSGRLGLMNSGVVEFTSDEGIMKHEAEQIATLERMLTDAQTRELAESYPSFTGGNIENICRKKTIQGIVSGKEPGFGEIRDFCNDENIGGRRAARKIGY